MKHQSLQSLLEIAHRLGDLQQEFVFLGGAVVPVWLEEPYLSDCRVTEDVDCVVEAATWASYDGIQARLRAMGFSHDLRPGAPICRFVRDGLVLDVMPHPGHGLGDNPWIGPGLRSPRVVTLAPGCAIRVFSPPFLLGTKVAAWRARGLLDPLASDDMADLVALLDGCGSLLEDFATAGDESLAAYVAVWALELLARPDLHDIIDGHISRVASRGRLHVLRRLRGLTR